jgi:hypothetical protein
MAQENRRKLSAKALAIDIRSGISDSELKDRYGLSDGQLQSLFKKLIDLGGITVNDLKNRGVKSEVAEEETEIQPTPPQIESETQKKSQQALQGVKNILAQAYEQIPPGSDAPQQEPPPTTGETSEQIGDQLKATVAEAWAWLPAAQSKWYNYFLKPFMFLGLFLVLFAVALVKPDFWWNERWRVYTLLLVFFPLAFYGAWKSEVMSRKEKAAIFVFFIVAAILGNLFKK